ncbi:hypothetical protein B7P43_G09820 [Cryptotermes secundus]|uniref:BTB domain-containing protein n=1 Tax=Cryptotermes secundus TaxID=105785 RepID=A0A2J7Q372_9NEOP|nr:hypothetical protein B7P43_G09820 [Cryptotermes secundus]
MAAFHPTHSGDIVHLNVGGTRFSTSRHTLMWVPDSFFTALLSGRISSLRDEMGAIFIDRDPKLFATILNYLRTRDIDLSVDIRAFRHEAEYYAIAPLVKRLMLCEDLSQSSCGDVLFYGYLPPPSIPVQDPGVVCSCSPPGDSSAAVHAAARPGSIIRVPADANTASVASTGCSATVNTAPASSSASSSSSSVTTMVAVSPQLPASLPLSVPATPIVTPPCSAPPVSAVLSVNSMLPTANNSGILLPGAHTHGTHPQPPQRSVPGHSRNSSLDLRVSSNGCAAVASRSSTDIRNMAGRSAVGHSRAASLDLRHTRNSSADLNKLFRNDVGLIFGAHQGSSWTDPLRVQIVKAHHNWIAVAYAHFVACYRLKDSSGWQHAFTSPRIESCIERIAINAKMAQGGGGEASSKMVAISYGSQVRLWGVSEDGTRTNIGTFNLHVRVEYLFFIGSQLVALSPTGKIGVWHAMTQHWQIQDVVPIASFDTAGSFLLLGCNNGAIYYIGR